MFVVYVILASGTLNVNYGQHVFAKIVQLSDTFLRELKFQALMSEYAVMELNTEKIKDEVKVMKDILRFISDIDKKTEPTRKFLCSNIAG